ncbi:MAG: TonB-dependent receptor [Bacteroidia bacterium]|nr:TonB-dependent receptor [Bacteroidia bacterium]
MNSLTTYHIKFCKKVIFLFVCFQLTQNLQSQNRDTTVHKLPEVDIIHSKQLQLENSKKSTFIDSLSFALYNTSSLSDLLSNQSNIHIKSYGNANIATTSMRGGNANHTALLWNGLNIQNALLGQTDLSIIPTLFFDNVVLEYGGGSAMWGSGAIGGSIHLQNKNRFNQGFETKLQTSVGSFGTTKIGTSVLLSYKKIISNTKVYYTNSDNNYSYKDSSDKENPTKKITHANYSSKGIMQEISYMPSLFQKINMRLWYNVMDRNLPSYSTAISKQKQLDENLKLSADWNYNKRKLNSTIRFGYFNDQLNYSDSIAQIYSETSVKTTIAEIDNIYKHKNHTFNFGINFTRHQSETKNYNETHDLTKLALFAAYKLNLLNSKFTYNIAARKETTNQTEIPFTGNTGIHYQLTKLIATKINANTSYRQPTLNDLYWNPGGNKNLKPEESYEIDGGIELNYNKNNFTLLWEATYFNRHTTNWIIWLPTDNAFWSPKNIAKVYSRGTETKTELRYNKKDFQVKLILNTSYVLSNNEKSKNENDNSAGKQLIYTPRYTGQGSISIGYQKLNFIFNNTYTGYRFTSTDNTNWLNPYYIANIKCSYPYSFNTINMELFCAINNLFNKNYAVVVNRPMPLRNYEIGLSINYHKIKKTTNVADKQKQLEH